MNQVKNIFGRLRARGASMKVAVAALTIAMASSAHAALPAWATGFGTTILGYFNDAMTEYGPTFLAIIGGLFLLRIIRKVVRA